MKSLSGWRHDSTSLIRRRLASLHGSLEERIDKHALPNDPGSDALPPGNKGAPLALIFALLVNHCCSMWCWRSKQFKPVN